MTRLDPSSSGTALMVVHASRGLDVPSLSSRSVARPSFPRSITVEKWPLGVFASIDAGLGVQARSGPRAGRADHSTARRRKSPRARPTTRERFLDRLGRARHSHHGRLRRLRGRELCRHSHRHAHRGPGAARDARRADPGDEGDRRLRPAAGRATSWRCTWASCRTTPPIRCIARCWP